MNSWIIPRWINNVTTIDSRSRRKSEGRFHHHPARTVIPSAKIGECAVEAERRTIGRMGHDPSDGEGRAVCLLAQDDIGRLAGLSHPAPEAVEPACKPPTPLQHRPSALRARADIEDARGLSIAQSRDGNEAGGRVPIVDPVSKDGARQYRRLSAQGHQKQEKHRAREVVDAAKALPGTENGG